MKSQYLDFLQFLWPKRSQRNDARCANYEALIESFQRNSSIKVTWLARVGGVKAFLYAIKKTS